MIRTTLLLPEALHQRMLLLSKRSGRSLSEIARELFERAVKDKTEDRMRRTYDVLKTMRGVGTPGITDASTTIDEILYGKAGAWRGSEDDEA